MKETRKKDRKEHGKEQDRQKVVSLIYKQHFHPHWSIEGVHTKLDSKAGMFWERF